MNAKQPNYRSAVLSFSVESEGFEPSSKHVTNKLSTRLSLHLIFDRQYEEERPHYKLSCCFLTPAPQHNRSQPYLVEASNQDPKGPDPVRLQAL